MPLSLAFAANNPTVWWPTNGAHMAGTQPFKAMVQGLDVSQYEMFWQVDNGQWNRMDNNYTDYQHKEASVDVTNWNWHGSGPYTVNFIAQQNGAVIGQQSEQIYVDGGAPAPVPAPVVVQPATTTAPAPVAVDPDPVHQAQTQTQTQTQTTTQAQPVVTVQATSTVSIQPVVNTVQVSQPVVTISAGTQLYVDPNSDASKQAVEWATSNPSGATAMQVLAAQPTAVWFGDWNSNVQNDVHTLVNAAAAEGTVPVLVAYNIPERDCGGFSSGGSDNPAGYTAWINQFAQGLGSSPAIVVLEPDALAQISCLSQADQTTRLQLLSSAVNALKGDQNDKVYLDAGHSGWIDPTTMAGNLKKAGVDQANGFALNVSNFMTTADEVNYGQQISSQLGGKHFVIDTSRNGNGSNGQWCNPSGMAIGDKPTLQTGNSLIDAFLWIKTPGESDGSCNGAPSAGVWWAQYALSLVLNAH